MLRINRVHKLQHYLLGALVLAVTSCSHGDSTPTPPAAAAASITLSDSSLSLGVQSTIRLDAIVKDASGATLSSKDISWTSDNSAVAAAVPGGASASVTGLSSGLAKVTASVNGLSASALIAVASSGSGTVGPGGGTVTTSGGEIKVDVPPSSTGGRSTNLCIVPTTGPTTSPVEVPGTGFELRNTGPLGTATLTLRYLPGALPAGVDESTLGLFALIDTTWTRLDRSQIDPVARLVKGDVTLPYTTATTTCNSQPAATVRVGGLVIKFTIQSASSGAPLRVGELRPVTALLSHAASSAPNLTWSSANDHVLKVTPVNATTTGGNASLLGVASGTADITSQVKARIGGLVISIKSAPLTANVLDNPILRVTGAGGGSGTITSAPSGISCTVTNGVVQPGPCAVRFPVGVPVSLTATPSSGSHFEGWSGDCTDPTTCVVTLSADRAATATFVQPVKIATSIALSGAVQGASFAQQLQVTGGTGTYTWSLISGSLPTGISLKSTGALGGTPTEAGVFKFSVRAASGTSADTAALQLTVAAPSIPAPSILTPAQLPGGRQGVAYNAQLTASGGTGTYAWSLTSGAWPAGITLTTSGLLTGTPTSSGTFNATVKVTSGAQSATLNVQMIIAPPVIPPPVIATTSPLPSGTQGVGYSAQLSATGGIGSYSWSLLSGAWPAGLTLTTSGALSGTPTNNGTFTATVQVTSGAQTASKALMVTIAPPALAVSSAATLPNGNQGVAYSFHLSASGGVGNYAWSVLSGALPSGLTLTSGGVIAGTPTVSGAFGVTVRVTSGSQSATKALQVTIAPPATAPLSITTPTTLPNGLEGAAYSHQLAATGGAGNYVWSTIGGAWPAGITLDSRGVVSGAPAGVGTFTATVQVTSGTQSDSRDMQITVLSNVAPPGGNSFVNACPAVIQPISLGGNGATLSVGAFSAKGNVPLDQALVTLSASSRRSRFGLAKFLTDSTGLASTAFASDDAPGSMIDISATISNSAGKLLTTTRVAVVDQGGHTKGYTIVSGDRQAIPVGTAGQPFVVNVGGAGAGLPVSWELQLQGGATTCYLGFTDRAGDATFVIPAPYNRTSGLRGSLIVQTPGEGGSKFSFIYR